MIKRLQQKKNIYMELSTSDLSTYAIHVHVSEIHVLSDRSYGTTTAAPIRHVQRSGRSAEVSGL